MEVARTHEAPQSVSIKVGNSKGKPFVFLPKPFVGKSKRELDEDDQHWASVVKKNGVQ